MPRSGLAPDRSKTEGGSGRLRFVFWRLALCTAVVLVAAPAWPQLGSRNGPASIETLAGGGPVGDGGPALAARLNLPGGVLEAPNGDLVIIDFGNHRIRRVDRQTGLIDTIVGTGEAGYNGDGIPARQAQLSRPEYATYGPEGDLYIADSYNNRVRKVDHATGLISTVAGSGERGAAGDGGPATRAEMHFPEGLTLDREGNLFIGDTVNRRIRRVDAKTGIITTYAGSGEVGVNREGTPAAEAKFLRLARIAIDGAGNLYVADSPTQRILVIDAATRQVRTYAGTGKPGFSGDGGPATAAQMRYPEGLFVAGNGDLYFADVANHRVRRVEARTGLIDTVAGNGEKGFAGDGGPAREARLWSPGRTWLDAQGNLLISDILNSRIRRVDARTGVISTVAGSGSFGDGGPANQAVLSVPGDVVYAHGKVYVADYGTRRVRAVDLASGVISTVAGGGTGSEGGIPATEIELLLPEGIAVDGGRALYIADNPASRVWKVDLATGMLSVFAGSGQPGYSGDGGPATAAQLYLPGAVAVGTDGTIYISDFGNQAVRVVDPRSGVIQTLSAAHAPGEGDPIQVGVVSLESTPQGLYHLVHDLSEVHLFHPEDRTVSPVPLAPGGLPAARSGDTQMIDVAVHGREIYLADPLGHRVLRFELGGATVDLLAGNGVQGFAGDGGPATQASLFQPGGVTVSEDGREVFIADTKNQRIRRVRLPAPERQAAGRRGIHSYELSNGLDLVVAVAPELDLAAVNLTAAIGSIDDPPAQSGMAHLLEHVTLGGSVALGSLDPPAEAAALAHLDRADRKLREARHGGGSSVAPAGTPSQTEGPDPDTLAALERDYGQALEAARKLAESGEILGGRLEAKGGIGLNATTGNDVTQYFGWMPVEHLEYWLSLEADRLQNPVFRRFYSEREVVLQEIEVLTGGRTTLQDRVMQQVFPGGPQAQPPAGDPAETRDIDRPLALDFFSRFYRPENLALAVVGNVDPAVVRRLAERHLGAWKPAAAGGPLPAPSESSTAAPRVAKFNSVRAPFVYFAFPRPALTGQEKAGLEVLAELFNSPELSPLKRRLLGEAGIAWDVFAEALYPSQKRPGAFLLRVSGNGGVEHEALIREATGVLRALDSTPEEDLAGAILQAELRLATELDDPPTLAALLAQNQAVHGNWSLPFDRLETLRHLTPAEVRRTAQKVLQVPADGGGS